MRGWRADGGRGSGGKEVKDGRSVWAQATGSSHPGPSLLKDLRRKHENKDELYDLKKIIFSICYDSYKILLNIYPLSLLFLSI